MLAPAHSTKHRSLLCIAILCCAILSRFSPAATVKIDSEKTGAPISKYIYGQFIEHLGRSIYGGVWAEMIEDRKFFFPISDKYDPWGTGTDRNWNAGEFHFLKASPWKVIGPAGTVSMDKEHPFVGEESPVIHLVGKTETGISEDGLALLDGKKYTGRIILAGEVDGPVIVRLVAEDGKAQITSIAKITAEYQTFPLEFTAAGNSDNARIEIISSGKGSFKIGAISLMPADNIHGFRQDTVALLKELDSPVYRWPGGNFVSGYNFRDGLGERDKRPPRKNPAWTSIEANDVGIHEFMDLMGMLNSEPYIALNTGLGTPEQAAEEVEYFNGAADTPMGKLRAQNGHPDSFGVHLWAVGNEMFGVWQLGYMLPHIYVHKNNTVADAIWKVDPKAQLVAVGEIGYWDVNMLINCFDHMSDLSEHVYVKEIKDDTTRHAAQLKDAIKKVADAHRQYRKDIPEMNPQKGGKLIPLVMDEWNFWYGDYLYGELGCQYHEKDALGVAMGLHEYFRNSDLFFMANYAQTVNVLGCIKTTRTAATLESTGLALKLYRNHFGTIPVTITEKPANLDISAAWTDEKQTALTVAIVNTHETAEELTLDLGGLALQDAAKRWEISGDPQAFNEPGKPPQIVIKEQDVTGTGKSIAIPANSIVMVRFEKK
jgi:alpha-N-arabinofuranosidase